MAFTEKITQQGQKTTDTLNGSISLEESNSRLIQYSSEYIPQAIFGRVRDGTTQIEVAQAGYDVLTCTDDQKVMSSRFNMYKIIQSGEITLTPRNSDVTLTTTDIGYSFEISIRVTDGAIDGDSKPMVRVYTDGDNKMDIKYSGIFYNDGTNKLMCNYTYGFDKIFSRSQLELKIRFNIRLTDGSFTFNPHDYFNIPIYYEICNQTYVVPIGGGGGGDLPDGKYYFLDTITYNTDNSVYGRLLSTKSQFYDGYSNHFPKIGLGAF